MNKDTDFWSFGRKFMSNRYLWFALLFLAFWIFFAPGPKHEEKFFILLVVAIFVIGTTVFILLSNSISRIPLLAVNIFFIGWTFATLKFSIIYGKEFWEVFVYDGMIFKIIISSMIYFFSLALLTNKVKHRFKIGELKN